MRPPRGNRSLCTLNRVSDCCGRRPTKFRSGRRVGVWNGLVPAAAGRPQVPFSFAVWAVSP
jgi:hypothetical protein